MNEPQFKWAGLGYQQVPGLANRHISRFLRMHRKSMRRFFHQHGMLEFAERMDIIKRSRQGMLEKNRMFQKVLDDYARKANPMAVPVSEAAPGAEAAPVQGEEPAVDNVGVSDPVRPAEQAASSDTGYRHDAGGSVDVVATQDVGSNGLVIEE